ncbi:hypothetical protein [Gracilinema caldarium]|uniref:Uncharacterized protein n=1 Tax=Gracilinema caldarium (strain ATCC 51460 / DSM 7334 / H1) TaxID=744872 RepID=F8F325_GRAC1|nr:hypothetical protein [Gracilinema caldarium]AEJ19933.1 hypothetical protein Spica_1791 [Gracilinema caldarium DSM 7334]
MNKYIVFLSLAILMISGCTTNYGKEFLERQAQNIEDILKTDTISDTTNGSYSYIINPFDIFYEKNDIHIMLYFLNHPKYESIEAMINDADTTQIRVILTKHDQTQIDYLNNQDKLNRIISDGTIRKTYFAEIEYKKEIIELKPAISMSFRTADQEMIDFYLSCSSAPSKKFAGLTNPEGHSAETSFPIMFREMSALANDKSKIIIDGKNYEIPVLVNIPIFFKGMKGYYSELFKMAVIRTGEKKLDITQYPSKIALGEKWVYSNGTNETEYVISRLENGYIEISSKMFLVRGIVKNNSIGILSVSTYPSNNEGSMLIQFEKPIFSNLSMVVETNFRINIDSHEDLITGKLIYDNNQLTQRFRLMPNEPSWARKRNIQIEVQNDNNKVKWTSTIQRESEVF